MVEFNNKTISYFFVGVLVVLAVGYIMGSGGGKLISGYSISNQTNTTCTDSDGGLNYNLKGNVYWNNLTYWDYCTSSINVAERYCSNSAVQTAYYNCPSGNCYDGACMTNTTTTTTTVLTTSTTALTSSTTLPLNQTGNLYVSSKPTGASVYLDGVYKAKTNTTIKGLAPKSYSLKLTKSGYVDWTASVWIYSGQTNYVNAILQPNKGSINITSIPKGANIYLDNLYKGTTNRILTNIATGLHNIKLNKTGYYDYTKNVTVYVNITSQVSALLIPKNSTGNLTG